MKINEITKNLALGTSTAELNDILISALNTLNIRTVSFTFYIFHPRSKQKIQYHFCTPSYESWHQHYLSEGYNDIDSTLHSIYQSMLPTEWNLKSQVKHAKTRREQQMRLDAITFGATGGLSIPFHGPGEDFATLTLVQMHDENWLSTREIIEPSTHIIGTHYFHHIRKCLLKEKISVDTIHLSTREHQCLSLTKCRYDVEDIAKELGITARTVNFHLQNVNKKLGAKNKHEAVNIAQSKHLIT